GSLVEVVVAPVPEVEVLIDSLQRFDRRGATAGGGDAGASSLAAFFAAAERVYAHAPWSAARDCHLLCLDAEAFGWEPWASARRRCSTPTRISSAMSCRRTA